MLKFWLSLTSFLYGARAFLFFAWTFPCTVPDKTPSSITCVPCVVRPFYFVPLLSQVYSCVTCFIRILYCHLEQYFYQITVEIPIKYQWSFVNGFKSMFVSCKLTFLLWVFYFPATASFMSLFGCSSFDLAMKMARNQQCF